MVSKIRFQDTDYLLIGGAIASPEAYAAGRASYAHLFDDGCVRRFGEQIGVKTDIEFLGEVEDPQLEDNCFYNIFTDPSWEGV